MNFKEAQNNMRFSYFGGGPGVLVSGIVWMSAGVVALLASVQISILVLFLGGMFIYPLGMMIAKWLKRPGNHHAENPLGNLALESTFLLFIGIFIAYSVAQIRSEWFYPVMLMSIGGRYLVFSTLYGMRIYWFLGGALALGGGLCLLFNAPFALGAFVGGTIEVVLSFVIINLAKM